MGVSVELGRTRLTVQEILGLTPGSIVELDRAAGAPAAGRTGCGIALMPAR